MAALMELSVEDVYDFIAEKGGKITNRELVKHFKKYLSGPDRPADAHQKFTEIVNTIATVKPENNVKYLILKKDFKRRRKEAAEPIASNKRSEIPTEDPSGCDIIDVQYRSDPPVSIKSTVSTGPWSPDLPPGHTPQPPPRRKSSRGKENRRRNYEDAKISPEDKDLQEVRTPSRRPEEINLVSPGSVKEKAQKLNKMSSEIDLSRLISGNSFNHIHRRRDYRHDKNAEDDDTSSVTTLDPRRKEWLISASRGDYHALVKMLKEEPKLAYCKDFNSYNALHWAAKHGNLDIIKLIAGTHRVNSNAKTSGGYTALHIAAMFGREEIMEVLINTYGADPNIRDFSGKRPIQYLPKQQAERFVALYPNMTIGGSFSDKSNFKLDSSSFHRIGSLNSKVKKTSMMSAGGRAITRMKSWGSADNIPDRHLMPPPKFFPKKKKSRKQQDYFSTWDSYGKSRSGDSDSDSNYSGSIF